MKRARATGVVLFTIGGLMLLFVFYELVGTTIVTKGHQSALRNEFRHEIAEPRVPPSIVPTREKPRPKAVPGAEARLVIPKIHVDVIVVRGVTLRALAWGPGVYPESADIGAPGSTAIAGHRTGWGAPFFRMDELQPGDPIVLETPKAMYSYRVTRTVVVRPDEIEVLKGDPDSSAKFKLTLTTCTPRFTARDRLVVWADLMATKAREADSDVP